MKRDGFTSSELICIVLIIGVLIMIGIQFYGAYEQGKRRSSSEAAQAVIETVKNDISSKGNREFCIAASVLIISVGAVIATIIDLTKGKGVNDDQEKDDEESQNLR